MNIIPIDNLNCEEISIYAHASEAELLHYNEPGIGVFIAETANVVIRALGAGYRIVSMLVEDSRMKTEAAPVFEKVKELYGSEVLDRLPIYVAPHEVATKLTGYNLVRGLWAVMERKPLIPLDRFCEDKNRIAILFDVVNPTNAGAIIRSAAALGMDGVILTAHSVNPLARRASRVSMGTIFQIPWTITKEGTNLPSFLHDHGFTTAAMALSQNSLRPDDEIFKKTRRLAIFLGSEGPGLPEEIISSCDHQVIIPMYHNVDSLNVVAAGAIMFWELCK